MSSRISIDFKPVTGSNREERMKIVRNYLENTRAPLYGSQQPLIGQILSDSSRCRLVLISDQPAGIFTHQKRLTDRYKNFGYNDAVEMDVFNFSLRKTDETFASFQRALDAVKDLVKEWNPKWMVIRLHRSEEATIRFLEQERFVKTKLDDSFSLYALRMNPAKRKGEEISSAAPVRPRIEIDPKPMPKPVTLQGQYIRMILDGSKTVEGRIKSGMFNNVRVGSLFKFFAQSLSVVCEVTGVRTYRSFREMLSSEGYSKCIPTARSIDDAAAIYDRIRGYPERARQHGVVALEIKKVEGA